MDPGLELTPIPAARRSASFLDVFVLFLAANVVTTTMVTGGALSEHFSLRQALILVPLGVLVGTVPIALLARLGPRTGLPTMVLLRRPFGRRGAAAISLLLVVTNFAWIALNNGIAAGATSSLAGGPEWVWNLAVGAVAVLIALYGPRAMVAFDKLAVPALGVVGLAITWALVGGAGRGLWDLAGGGDLPWPAGLDLVVGYQVSWALMFADYTRYQRSERAAAWASGLGLALASLWLMSLGAAAGLAGGGADPTGMILALALPAPALLLVALSTITTNFVNIYLSSLALRNLAPRLPGRVTVLLTGGVGTLLGLVSPGLLDRYAEFMGWIASLLLPLLAVALVYFFAPVQSSGAAAEAASGDAGAPPRERAWNAGGVAAWVAGAVTYHALSAGAWPWGATLPTLFVAGAVAWMARLRNSQAGNS